LALVMPSLKLFPTIEPEEEAEPKLWFGESLNQPPLWRSLLDNLRERLFPPKLPPLELTSKPVVLPDEKSPFHYGKPSAGISLALHAAGLGAVFALSLAGARVVIQPKPTVTLVEPPVSAYVLHASNKPGPSGGGGGGGSHDKLPAPKGRLPKIAMTQLAPPVVVIRNEQPKLPVEPTVVAAPEMQLPQTAALNLGDPISGIPGGAPSNGPGLGGGIGSGRGGGVGSGTGPGVGPGHGGGYGGGVFRVGSGITAPRVISDPTPEYSDEARKAKFEGTVILWLIVDSFGRPRDVKVARSLGMGLDEKALEAVRMWKFKPAMKDGSPVAVEVNVEVNFHLY
jgi:periplasmic protein TonB